jgi:predicted nucleic-acid-binding protein
MASMDTNVLVRFLVRDDESQFEQARQLIEHQIHGRQPLYIPITVALELDWVLRARYKLDKKAVTDIYTRLLRTMELNFESESALEIALHHYKARNVDFADCLHAALAGVAGQAPFYTFDRKATRIPGTVSL